MKIDYLSDLHIDFYFSRKEPITNDKMKKLFEPIITKNGRIIGDVLIIAGDIGHYNYQNINVLKYLKENYYKHIICVLGNHDYYLLGKEVKSQFKNSFERIKNMRDLINSEENMYCLDGNIIQISGINFSGCDSWYNDGYFKRQYPTQNFSRKSTNIQWHQTMNDAGYIYGIDNFDDIWEIEKPKVEAIYKKCDVMITHINPSCKDEHINIRYQNNPSNVFFSFDGEKYLKEGSMSHWIFGHTHEELEYQEFDVNCLCNPLGYPNESSNGKFVEMKSFELDKTIQ